MQANGDFGSYQIEILNNPVMFSDFMHGATLVYSWLLSILKYKIALESVNNEVEAGEDWEGYQETKSAENWVGHYEAKLDEWTDRFELNEISVVIRGQNHLYGGACLFSRYWQLTLDQGQMITQSTHRLVENWSSMLLDQTIFRGNYQAAGELIKYRVIELKRTKRGMRTSVH